jgi:hypothetical protein
MHAREFLPRTGPVRLFLSSMLCSFVHGRPTRSRGAVTGGGSGDVTLVPSGGASPASWATVPERVR